MLACFSHPAVGLSTVDPWSLSGILGRVCPLSSESPTQKPNVSLRTETGKFLWMSSPHISDGPLFFSYGFSISLDLRALEVLCCPYWHSFYQTDHSSLWWIVVGANLLMLCQECAGSASGAIYCSSCTLQCFFAFWKISWLVTLMTPLWWLLCNTEA